MEREPKTPVETAPADPGGPPAYLRHFRQLGYAVIPGVFDRQDMKKLAVACDRLMARAQGHGESFESGEVFFRMAPDPNLGQVLRIVQWPSHEDDVLDAYRLDRRLFELIRPLIGADVKQVVNQLHWKPPGAASVAFGYHQDFFFRNPPEAYRSAQASYVQTAIAIDHQCPDNGGLVVYPGSHKLGLLDFPERGAILETPLLDADLKAVGLEPAKAVSLVLEPGDVVLWTLQTVHGSGPNRTQNDRRLYINGYIKAESCDVGHWAFRAGKPCRLASAPVR